MHKNNPWDVAGWLYAWLECTCSSPMKKFLVRIAPSLFDFWCLQEEFPCFTANCCLKLQFLVDVNFQSCIIISGSFLFFSWNQFYFVLFSFIDTLIWCSVTVKPWYLMKGVVSWRPGYVVESDLNFWFSWFTFQSAAVTGAYHCVNFMCYNSPNPEPWELYTGTLPTVYSPNPVIDFY